MADQHGHAPGGRQANVGNDYHDHSTTNYNTYNGPKPDTDESEPGDGGTATAAKAGGGGGIVALLIAGYLLTGGEEPFPTTSDPLPSNASNEIIIKSATDWLDNCRKSNSPSPANCPQKLTEAVPDETSKVRWIFAGNPTEGAVVKYTHADSRFDVLGTMVVVADYLVGKEARREVTPMTYWATLTWADGQAQVQQVKKFSQIGGGPDIKKPDPQQPAKVVLAEVGKAFAVCAAGRDAIMPPGCPGWPAPPGVEKVKRAVSTDPLLTALPAFDQEYGIMHVTGSYGMTMAYRSVGGPKTDGHNSEYEARVALTPTGPTVLDIRDTP